MTSNLTKFQKQLCNALQNGVPICARPFAEIAECLNVDQEQVLREASGLIEAGVIRRISATVDYRALGKTSTLVTAHVPQESVREVAEAVNSLDGVSHNYLRNHHYNMWFTLQADTAAQIDATLADLSERFGFGFHSLPVKRFFKLYVLFDAESESEVLLRDVQRIPKCEVVELSDEQKLVLSQLQRPLELTAEPFDLPYGGGVEHRDALKIITGLIDAGVIRRIAAVVNHRKLGFVANAMFAGEVPQDRIVGAGERLASLGIVSHCYERETFESWPYNLFAMCHGRSMDQIRHVVSKFTEAEKVNSFELLETAAELKKKPVKHTFG